MGKKAAAAKRHAAKAKSKFAAAAKKAGKKTKAAAKLAKEMKQLINAEKKYFFNDDKADTFDAFLKANIKELQKATLKARAALKKDDFATARKAIDGMKDTIGRVARSYATAHKYRVKADTYHSLLVKYDDDWSGMINLDEADFDGIGLAD